MSHTDGPASHDEAMSQLVTVVVVVAAVLQAVVAGVVVSASRVFHSKMLRYCCHLLEN